uniref:Uncharacterized protein n=1 Tax=Solanum lycopersicum TaxID=4081 RepID=A0A3Q7ECH5_SOLLC
MTDVLRSLQNSNDSHNIAFLFEIGGS